MLGTALKGLAGLTTDQKAMLQQGDRACLLFSSEVFVRSVEQDARLPGFKPSGGNRFGRETRSDFIKVVSPARLRNSEEASMKSDNWYWLGTLAVGCLFVAAFGYREGAYGQHTLEHKQGHDLHHVE